MKLTRQIRELTPSSYLGAIKTIEYIDPGHGGMIDGKYTTAPKKMFDHGEFIFYEGLWNRAIAWMYATELYIHGLSYKIVADGNIDFSLGYRVNAANMHYHQLNGGWKAYYHSIHGNAFGNQLVNGIEVYTSPGDTPADPIATVMYNNLESILKWRMRPGWGLGKGEVKPDVDKEARFTVLMDTEMPSILSETGFYTNLAECKKMMEYSNMQKIVRAFRKTHETVVHKHML